MYNAALIDESGNCSDCTIGCDSASSTYAYLGGTVYIFEKYITPDSEKCVKIKSCELSSGFVSERVIENCEPQFRGTFAVDSSGNGEEQVCLMVFRATQIQFRPSPAFAIILAQVVPDQIAHRPIIRFLPFLIYFRKPVYFLLEQNEF